jgi:ribose 5-phosphate isomerase B
MAKKLITENTVKAASTTGKIIYIPERVIITALARDLANKLGMTFQTRKPEPDKVNTSAQLHLNDSVIAIGCDHGGFEMKVKLIKVLNELQFKVVDVGTHSTETVDYPDFARVVAEKVASGECGRGIMIDGAGIGSCMVVNKFKGVRGAMCYDISSAVNSREHNNANVLTLGGKMTGEFVSEQIVRTWLKTDFAGGRHQKRIDKIIDIDKINLK